MGDREIDAVVEVLRSGMLKGGLRCRELEQAVAAHFGDADAVASVSGTQSLHLLLRALFDGSAADVALPTYVCRSVYDAVLMAGCRPVVVDIDPFTCTIDAAATPEHVAAVIVPHMFGVRAPVEHFAGCGVIIEDCAQRLTPVGVSSEPRGHFRVVSLEATKLITCGEGGLISGLSTADLQRCRLLRDGSYEDVVPGWQLPMTDMQAAVALVQLARLDEFLSRRRSNAQKYLSALDEAGLGELVHPAMRRDDTWHARFLLQVRDVDCFMATMAASGVTSRRPVAPRCVHHHFSIPGEFRNAEQALANWVSVPVHPGLADDDVATVVRALVRAARRA